MEDGGGEGRGSAGDVAPNTGEGRDDLAERAAEVLREPRGERLAAGEGDSVRG